MSEQFVEVDTPAIGQGNGLKSEKKQRPPYRPIAGLLRQGHVVPFLGSGVNMVQRPDAKAKFDHDKSEFLPNGQELASWLAAKCKFPSQEVTDLSDLAKVASYYVDIHGRPVLFEELRGIFHKNYDPTGLHTYLAEVASAKPLLIVTTNYDVMTEKAFDDKGVPYHLVIHQTERKDKLGSVLWWKPGEASAINIVPNQLNIDLKSASVIYKMHGTVDRSLNDQDSYVITEDDYVDFLTLMTKKAAVPKQFIRHFNERQFLFLGYALRDWNLRLVLRQVTAEAALANRRSWAIQVDPSALDQALWSKRSVTIYDVAMDEFMRELRAADAALLAAATT
ncbi:MAG: SIR2 family NAD-dependent protein deacylase [Pyrinomonadaceae bacterium]